MFSLLGADPSVGLRMKEISLIPNVMKMTSLKKFVRTNLNLFILVMQLYTTIFKIKISFKNKVLV